MIKIWSILRDTVIVCTADVFTGFYGGLVVYAVLGFLSKETGIALHDLPFSGRLSQLSIDGDALNYHYL
jgi:hypothetical protein